MASHHSGGGFPKSFTTGTACEEQQAKSWNSSCTYCTFGKNSDKHGGGMTQDQKAMHENQKKSEKLKAAILKFKQKKNSETKMVLH